MIVANRLPAPMGSSTTALDDEIYVLVLPDKSSDANACNVGGGCNFPSNNIHNTTAPFQAVYVLNGSGNTGLFGHETSEAISAYNPAESTGGQGVVVTNCGGNNQVADVCQCGTEYQNGIFLGAYWSAQHQTCIIPESWGELEVNAGSGWAAPQGDILIQQASGGAGGVVATFASNSNSPGSYDSAYFYNGSEWLGYWDHYPTLHGVASAIGTGGAEVVAGGNNVVSIPNDPGSGVEYYDLTRQVWTNLGLPPITLAPDGDEHQSGGQARHQCYGSERRVDCGD